MKISKIEEIYKFTQFRGRVYEKGIATFSMRDMEGMSVYGKNGLKCRKKVGKEQLLLAKKNLKNIDYKKCTIDLSKEFLVKMGLNEVNCIEYIFSNNSVEMINYNEIRVNNGLNNESHIIWMKFTKDGYLGTVAAGTDINFDEGTTSSKIIKHLRQEWDTSFVLIFPLKDITDGLRKDIECGIGNYLSHHGIPILDYFSHRFQ